MCTTIDIKLHAYIITFIDLSSRIHDLELTFCVVSAVFFYPPFTPPIPLNDIRVLFDLGRRVVSFNINLPTDIPLLYLNDSMVLLTDLPKASVLKMA